MQSFKLLFSQILSDSTIQFFTANHFHIIFDNTIGMRVATVDGLVTLFYDGSKELWNRELHQEWLRQEWFVNGDGHDVDSSNVSDECKSYIRGRLSWQQIIVVEGVTEIPEFTFERCYNIQRVIFANTVIRIEMGAFLLCKNLVFIEWSISLEYIGEKAFRNCNLSSIFIPPRCQNIGDFAFSMNNNLEILSVPQNTALGYLEITGSTIHTLT